MYKLNISTPSCMAASLPISADVANFLLNRLESGPIPRNKLLQQIGYPVGVGSNSGSFLDSVYNFANAILKESNSDRFNVQIEAIPAKPKLNPIFTDATNLPEPGRPVVVVFVDQTILLDVEYCGKCQEWHSSKGSLRVSRIHQWAYQEEFYNQLNLPEFPKEEPKQDDRSKGRDPTETLAGVILLSALLGKKIKL